MDAFYERLVSHAATIDELLSDDFEPVPGPKGDAEAASQRLAAWSRPPPMATAPCSSGGWRGTA